MRVKFNGRWIEVKDGQDIYDKQSDQQEFMQALTFCLLLAVVFLTCLVLIFAVAFPEALANANTGAVMLASSLIGSITTVFVATMSYNSGSSISSKFKESAREKEMERLISVTAEGKKPPLLAPSIELDTADTYEGELIDDGELDQIERDYAATREIDIIVEGGRV